jgi:hypothetical protein
MRRESQSNRAITAVSTAKGLEVVGCYQFDGVARTELFLHNPFSSNKKNYLKETAVV